MHSIDGTQWDSITISPDRFPSGVTIDCQVPRRLRVVIGATKLLTLLTPVAREGSPGGLAIALIRPTIVSNQTMRGAVLLGFEDERPLTFGAELAGLLDLGPQVKRRHLIFMACGGAVGIEAGTGVARLELAL